MGKWRRRKVYRCCLNNSVPGTIIFIHFSEGARQGAEVTYSREESSLVGVMDIDS
jgi:hypothetical protein